MTEAIILAGGFGTRLRSLKLDVPKPMILVNGTPFLKYLINYLKVAKVEKIILSVGYKWEKIEEFFGRDYRGIQLEYSIEEKPLGTGGAVRKAIGLCEQEEVLILNGDTFFEVDIEELLKFHILKNSVFTIASKWLNDLYRYGNMVVNNNGRICKFLEKQSSGNGLINGGVYYINKNFYLQCSMKGKFSLETEILEKYVKTEDFFAYRSDGYFIDIGLPVDYYRAGQSKILQNYA